MGPAGSAGAAGLKGDTGATGAAGSQGTPGYTGGKGDIGPAGPAGPAGSGGLRVVDVNGIDVGMLSSSSSVIREIEGAFVQIPMNAAGFSGCSTTVGNCMTHLFEKDMCAGTSYLSPEYANDSLVPDAFVVDDTIVYPVGPAATQSIRSYRTDSGTCYQINGSQQAVEVKSVPVSSLGLVAPFHVAR